MLTQGQFAKDLLGGLLNTPESLMTLQWLSLDQNHPPLESVLLGGELGPSVASATVNQVFCILRS